METINKSIEILSNAGTSLIDCSDGKRRKKTTQVIKL